MEAVKEDGTVFITNTKIKGNFTLRVAILAFRTHLSTVKYALKVLQKKAAELEGSLHAEESN